MTTTQEHLQVALQAAAERGGLASLATFDEVRHQLMDLSKCVAEIRSYANAVANAYGDEIPVPFTVSTENVAALGLIAQEIREELIELDRSADSIAGNLWAIDGVRRVQEADDAPSALPGI